MSLCETDTSKMYSMHNKWLLLMQGQVRSWIVALVEVVKGRQYSACKDAAMLQLETDSQPQ